jgi:hypothetical protein
MLSAAGKTYGGCRDGPSESALVLVDDRQRRHDVIGPSGHTSLNALSIYVCRTRISCVFPQAGHSTLIFFDHAARRLAASMPMPVGARCRVSGQVKFRKDIGAPLDRRERYGTLSHRRLRAKPWSVMYRKSC